MIQNEFNLKITVMTIWHEHLDLIIGSQLWKKIPVDQSESLLCLTGKRRAILPTNKNQEFTFLINMRTDLGQEDRRRDI